jgi:hypothetical protein
MNDDNAENKPTHMDEHLKILVVQKWENAIDYSIHEKYAECFHAYHALYLLIDPYDFPLKQEMRKIADTLSEYLRDLEGQPVNKRQILEINDVKHEFRDLLDTFKALVPRAYHSLGLWFRTAVHYEDLDKKLSMELFDSDFTGVGNKKKELSELSTKKLLSLMTPNAIHDAYAALRIEQAYGEESDEDVP